MPRLSHVVVQVPSLLCIHAFTSVLLCIGFLKQATQFCKSKWNYFTMRIMLSNMDIPEQNICALLITVLPSMLQCNQGVLIPDSPGVWSNRAKFIGSSNGGLALVLRARIWKLSTLILFGTFSGCNTKTRADLLFRFQMVVVHEKGAWIQQVDEVEAWNHQSIDSDAMLMRMCLQTVGHKTLGKNMPLIQKLWSDRYIMSSI